MFFSRMVGSIFTYHQEMIAALHIQRFEIEPQLHREIIVFRGEQHRCNGSGLSFRANCKRLQTSWLECVYRPSDTERLYGHLAAENVSLHVE